MREAKKKGIVIVLAVAFVMLATPFIGTVMAGKGQERLSIMFDIGFTDSDTVIYGKFWNCPKKVEFPEVARVLQIRDADMGDPATHADFIIVVDEAGLNIEFDNDDITYSCSEDLVMRNLFYGQEALPYVI